MTVFEMSAIFVGLQLVIDDGKCSHQCCLSMSEDNAYVFL